MYATIHTGNAYTHMRMTVRKRWEAPKRCREYRELWVCIGGRREAAGFKPLRPGNLGPAIVPELVRNLLDGVEEITVLARHNRSISDGGHLGPAATSE